jgi:hypothetical protein
MKSPPKTLLVDHYQIHNRFSDAEYLIDHKTYRYVLDFVKMAHQSIHQVPDDEFVLAKRLVDDEHTETCTLRINEMVFV